MTIVQACGAGRQSTALLLMSCEGLVPKIDFAIFSDTGWEFPEVYDHLAALTEYAADFGIPIYRASHGYLQDDVLDPSVFATIPCHTVAGTEVQVPVRYATCGTCGGFRMLREDEERCEDCAGQGQVPVEWEWRPAAAKFGKILRQCTGRYKVQPLERRMRELLGAPVWGEPCVYCSTSGRRVAPWDPWQREGTCSVCRGTGERNRVGSVPKGTQVEQWIGFSADEYERATTAGFPAYVTPYHPLIQMGWTAARCVEWMAERGWKGVTKSSCMGCPFHDDDTWLEIADRHPGPFAELIAFDVRLREEGTGMRALRYLHESRKPLDQAVADYRAMKAERGVADVLWPEFRPKRKVRHCNPFGCRSEDMDDDGIETVVSGPT